MLRGKKLYKGLVAYSLAMGILIGTIPASSVMASNLEKFQGVEITQGVNNENFSLQPTGNGYSIKTLIEWSPESDKNAKYNRASIKLQDRFTGPLVNENANKDAKIMNCALTNPQSDNAPSQGANTENAYVFSYWQYIDSYVYWGGTSKGIFLPPTPDVVDAAHKNGVTVMGTVGFPWGPGEGHVEQIREFLQKDSNGKFIVADKMIEMARFYGFDGWFINQESYGCSKDDATLMVEFFTYLKEAAPDLKIGWYDSMTTDGPVRYQDALNPLNVGFFQNEGKTVTDEFFLNYNWDRPSSSFPEKTKIDMSVDTANSVGRSQYDIFAGVEVQQNAYNDKFPVEHLLDKDGKIRTSLALYCPNSTFSMAKDVDDFYKHDSKFWVGEAADPSNTNTEDEWVGMANYVADKSAINSLPFTTNFNLGHGKSYYVDGKISSTNEWNNRAIQDYLPTWRWIVNSDGSKLTPNFDRDDAYNGGSSLKVEGNLEAKNSNNIMLYSTDLDIKKDTNLEVMYKSNSADSKVQIGLCFGDDYSEENFTYVDLNKGNVGEWTNSNVSLNQFKGKKISAISLKVSGEQDINDLKVNLGSISIKENEKSKKLDASDEIVLDEKLIHNAQKAEAKIYWEDVDSAELYEIYRTKPDGNKEYIGSTYNNAYYIQPFNRYNNEKSFNFEVVAVDKNKNKGKAAKLKFDWGIGANDTDVPDEKEIINLALNMPVVASSQNAGEPGYKAVDGTVDNNSKWCTTSELAGAHLTVDLGEEKTIQRWVTMHGEAGGEDKTTNTDSFRLQVSSDGVTFTDVDKVVGNEEGIVDRNLESPVKGRYFRIVIDDPGKSPWKAVRLYEFQLFEDTAIAKTENISLKSVKVENNKGNSDKIFVKDLMPGQEIRFYKNINDKEAFVSKVVEDTNIITIDNLDLGKKEGRVFYSIKEDGKEESIKLSAGYESENAKQSKIPDRDDFEIEKYTVEPRDNESYYATLEADIKKGEVINLYENENDIFPIRTSIEADKDEAILERLLLKKSGGEIILSIKGSGTKESSKFKLKYDNKMKIRKIEVIK
ncbi:MAG: endo-beta-N-acetylglucosaminidase [Sarcina sp.]